jgi:hypothetical protein
MDKVERFRKIAESITAMYEKKNTDYNDAFGLTFNEYGPLQGLGTIQNKIYRVKHLLENEAEPYYESVIESLQDIANYCIMLQMELEDISISGLSEATARRLNEMTEKLIKDAEKYVNQTSTVKDIDYVVNTIKEKPVEKICGTFKVTDDGDEVTITLDNTKEETSKFAEALEEFIATWFDEKVKEDGNKK